MPRHRRMRRHIKQWFVSDDLLDVDAEYDEELTFEENKALLGPRIRQLAPQEKLDEFYGQRDKEHEAGRREEYYREMTAAGRVVPAAAKRRMMPDLVPLTRTTAIKPFATFDIESENWKDFKFCGIYDGTAYRRYETIGETCDALFSHSFREYALYAHNCGKFDGMFLIDELSRRKEWSVEPVISGGRMLEIRVEDRDRHRWFVRDSYALLPSSLKKLTMNFKVQHQKLDEDAKGMLSNPEYNRNDCIGLYEVLDKFRDLNRGTFGLTIARTALDDYRRNFQKVTFRSVRSCEEEIRKAYYGGRTEIFQFNTNPDKVFYDYDVNSLYPFVLREYDYPYGRFKSVHPDIDDFGFSYARVREQHRYPILPQRLDYKMMFMHGWHEGWYSNEELRLAEKVSPFDFEVTKTLACEEHAPVFREYIDDLYGKRLEARAEGNEALAYVLKLKMNSFYGKWGQRRKNERILINPEFIEEGMKLEFVGDLPIFKKTEDSDSPHIIPSVSAMVTAYARAYMWKWFTGVADSDLFYMDTDSIITSSPCLEESKKLGAFKLEAKMERFYPIMPKVYYYELEGQPHVRAKGLPMQDMASFRAYLDGQPVTDDRGVETFKRSCQRGNGTTLLFNKQTKRTLASYYDKRKMLEEGRTYPFEQADKRSQNKAEFEKLRIEICKKIA